MIRVARSRLNRVLTDQDGIAILYAVFAVIGMTVLAAVAVGAVFGAGLSQGTATQVSRADHAAESGIQVALANIRDIGSSEVDEQAASPLDITEAAGLGETTCNGLPTSMCPERSSVGSAGQAGEAAYTYTVRGGREEAPPAGNHSRSRTITAIGTYQKVTRERHLKINIVPRVFSYALYAAGAYHTGAPTAVSPPLITGTPSPGHTLTVQSPGEWDPQPESYEYHWRACTATGKCTTVGSNSTNYLVTEADYDHTIYVNVTARRGSFETTASSNSFYVKPPAGRYTVYSCHKPNGEGVEALYGWSETYNLQPPDTFLWNECHGGTYGFGGQLYTHNDTAVNGIGTMWTFFAPEHTHLVEYHITMPYAYCPWTGTGGGEGQVWLEDSTLKDPNYVYRCLGNGTLPSGETQGFGTFCEEDTVCYKPASPSAFVDMFDSCDGGAPVGQPGSVTCPASPANMMVARSYITRAELLLEDESAAPTGSASGPLVEEGEALHGTVPVTITAKTTSPLGVYSLIFNVDGTDVSSQVLDSSKGLCENVGSGFNGTNAFISPEPCPSSVKATATLNTARLIDGEHTLKLYLSSPSQHTHLIGTWTIYTHNYASTTSPVPPGTALDLAAGSQVLASPYSLTLGPQLEVGGSIASNGDVTARTGAEVNHCDGRDQRLYETLFIAEEAECEPARPYYGGVSWGGFAMAAGTRLNGTSAPGATLTQAGINAQGETPSILYTRAALPNYEHLVSGEGRESWDRSSEAERLTPHEFEQLVAGSTAEHPARLTERHLYIIEKCDGNSSHPQPSVCSGSSTPCQITLTNAYIRLAEGGLIFNGCSVRFDGGNLTITRNLKALTSKWQQRPALMLIGPRDGQEAGPNLQFANGPAGNPPQVTIDGDVFVEGALTWTGGSSAATNDGKADMTVRGATVAGAGVLLEHGVFDFQWSPLAEDIAFDTTPHDMGTYTYRQSFPAQAFAPTVTITHGPGQNEGPKGTNITGKTSGTVTFTTTGEPTKITCQLDEAPEQPCESPYHVYGLKPSSHHKVTVRVANIDGSGEASYEWDVAGGPPTVSITPGKCQNATVPGRYTEPFKGEVALCKGPNQAPSIFWMRGNAEGSEAMTLECRWQNNTAGTDTGFQPCRGPMKMNRSGGRAHGEWTAQPAGAGTTMTPLGHPQAHATLAPTTDVAAGPEGHAWAAETTPGGEGRIQVLSGEGQPLENIRLTGEPHQIIRGPEDTMWVTEPASGNVAAISSTGTVAEQQLGAATEPYGLTTGPSDPANHGAHVWVADRGADAITSVSQEAGAKKHPLPPADAHPRYIAAGPNGLLWITTPRRVITYDPTLQTTHTAYEAPKGGSLQSIALAPNGDMWAADQAEHQIVAINPTTDATSTIPLAGGPLSLATAGDDTMWATEPSTDTIAQITAEGEVDEHALASTEGIPQLVAAGPNGAPWYGLALTNAVGSIGLGKPTLWAPGKWEFTVRANDGANGTAEASAAWTETAAGPPETLWQQNTVGDNPQLTGGTDTLNASVHTGAPAVVGCELSIEYTEYPYPATSSARYQPSCATSGPVEDQKASWQADYYPCPTVAAPQERYEHLAVAPTHEGAGPGEDNLAYGYPYRYSLLAQNAYGTSELPASWTPTRCAMLWKAWGGITEATPSPARVETQAHYTAYAPGRPTGTIERSACLIYEAASGSYFAGSTAGGTEEQQPNSGSCEPRQPGGESAEYPLPEKSYPWSITNGPGGEAALWFTDAGTSKIGRITTSGQTTEYALPAGSEPEGITTGTDGALWFTDYKASKIGRITTSGQTTEYALPEGSHPSAITAGPAGEPALWFTDAGTSKIGRITTSGQTTEYALPAGSEPEGITTGADGALWFTAAGTSKIGRITTSGQITEYALPAGEGRLTRIARGAENTMWFTAFRFGTEHVVGVIGSITTSGQIAEYELPEENWPWDIAEGPDGAMWFTQISAGKLGRITASGQVTEHELPAGGFTTGITTGPNHNIWYSNYGANQIGQLSTEGGGNTTLSETTLTWTKLAHEAPLERQGPWCLYMQSEFQGGTTPVAGLESTSVGGNAKAFPGSAGNGTCPGLSDLFSPSTATGTPVNIKLPAITGTAKAGETLTASHGSWSNSPSSYAYQWQDCNEAGLACQNIEGATKPSYTVAKSDSGDTIRVRVAASNEDGFGVADSNTTSAVPSGPVNISQPYITGGAAVGKTLTANVGEWAKGPESYTYQWERCNEAGDECTSIEGATGKTYVATTADASHTLRVIVTAHNAAGAGTATAAHTELVVSEAARNLTAPTIEGTAKVSETLTATRGEWAGPPTSYEYQWERCNETGGECARITEAATRFYEVTEADEHRTLRVNVQASNVDGAASATSEPTSPIPGPPVNSVLPTITNWTSGSPTNVSAGDLLTADEGAWRYEPTSYAYQWLRCGQSGAECAPIAGASGESYSPTTEDAGHTIRVKITATNEVGPASVDSEPTGVVDAPASTNAPSVEDRSRSGEPPREGDWLYISRLGEWTHEPTSYAYQWLRCTEAAGECAPITGATGRSYFPTSADVGHAIRAQVTATNSVGSGSAHSEATATVVISAPQNTSSPSISGTAAFEATLTASPGEWTHNPSYAYQWERCNETGGECAPIEGGTGESYTVREADIGHTIRVKVTATDSTGSTAATSKATGKIVAGPPLNASLPTISHTRWAQTELAGAPSLTAVACAPGTRPASGLCMVVGEGPAAYLATNPDGGAAAWHASITPSSGHLAASCASTSFCMSTSGGLTMLAAISGSSATWTQSAQDQNQFHSDACPSSDFCAHINGGYDGVAYSTEPANASAWGPRVTVEGLVGEGLSCAPGTTAPSGLCVDVGPEGKLSSTTTPDKEWPVPLKVDSTNTLTAVSCPSEGFCAAVDNKGNVLTTTEPSTPAGWALYGHASNIDGSTALTGISCPSASFCAATDAAGRVLISTNPTGGSAAWHTEPVASSRLTGISCTTSAFCVAVDAAGRILTYSQPQGTLTTTTGEWENEPASYTYQWERCNETGGECAPISGATHPSYTETTADTGHALRATVTATNVAGANSASASPTGVLGPTRAQTVHSGTSLEAVACLPWSSTCTVTSTTGGLFDATAVSTTKPAEWTPWTGPGTGAGVALSCPNASLCVLAETNHLYEASTLGGPWSEVTTAAGTISGVSCPSSGFCAASGQEGALLWSAKPDTAEWHHATEGTATLRSLDCLADSFCAAVDNTGNVHIATTESQVRSNEWTATNIDGSTPLTGIACTTRNSCVAIDGEGHTLALAISKTGTATVHIHESDPGHSLTGVSCIASTCVAVDNAGNVYASEDAGEEWLKTYIHGTALTGVSCASLELCVATDTAGNVFAFWAAAPAVPVNTAQPTIDDVTRAASEAREGDRLVAEHGEWTHEPTSYAYQWERCNDTGGECAPISGATGETYTPVEADANHLLRVKVTATNTVGSGTTISTATATITIATPENTSPPSITGTTQVGQPLTATPGEWTHTPSYAYQWERCSETGGECAPISGATGETYTPVEADANHTLRVKIAATDSTGTTAATSPATEKVQHAPPANTAAPTLQLAQWAQTGLAGTPNLTAISCAPGTHASSGLCMAVESGTTALLATDPAGGTSAWHASTTPDAGHLAVSCPSASLCLTTTSGQTDIASVTAATASWTKNNHNNSNFAGVSCPSAAFCAHIDSNSGVVWTETPTSSGEPWVGVSGDTLTGLQGRALSCAPGTGPTSGLCVEVGQEGRVASTTSPAGTWTTADVDGAATLTAVSCPSTAFCAATDNQGNVLTSSEPNVPSSWQIVNISLTAELTSISCSSASFCAATDSLGSILTSTSPAAGPGAWSAEPVSLARLTGISCPTADFCAAIDNGGQLYTYTGSTSASLHASIGSWTGEPTSYSFKWMRCNQAGEECAPIEGTASAYYTVTSADTSHTIRVEVTATNATGSGNATSTIAQPIATTTPTVSGTAEVAQTLTASLGEWSGAPTTRSRQWLRCNTTGGECTSIEGATGETYVPTKEDIAHTIRVRVTATNSAGSGNATSQATGPVPGPPVNTSAPEIEDLRYHIRPASYLYVEYEAKAYPGTWANKPTSYSYQWQRNLGSGWTNIAGATSATLAILPPEDLEASVRVALEACSAAGCTTSHSEPAEVR